MNQNVDQNDFNNVTDNISNITRYIISYTYLNNSKIIYNQVFLGTLIDSGKTLEHSSAVELSIKSNSLFFFREI